MSRCAAARHSSLGQLFQFLRAPVQTPQCDLWTAGSAGDRFGVETTIARVCVFRFARRAHRERRHRRIRAIVGDSSNNREARPAMRAIGEGIVGAPLARIRDFRGASATDGGVRCNLRMRAPLDARRDTEIRGHIPTTCLAFDAVYPRQWRRLPLQAVKENGDLILGAPQPNENALGVVKNFAAQAQRARKFPDRRAEPHALHAAPHTNFQRNDRGRVSLLMLGEHCLTPSLARHLSQVERKRRMSSLS